MTEANFFWASVGSVVRPLLGRRALIGYFGGRAAFSTKGWLQGPLCGGAAALEEGLAGAVVAALRRHPTDPDVCRGPRGEGAGDRGIRMSVFDGGSQPDSVLFVFLCVHGFLGNVSLLRYAIKEIQTHRRSYL